MPVVHISTGSAYRDMAIPPRFRDWTHRLERAAGIDDMWWTGNPDYAFRRKSRRWRARLYPEDYSGRV